MVGKIGFDLILYQSGDWYGCQGCTDVAIRLVKEASPKVYRGTMVFLPRMFLETFLAEAHRRLLKVVTLEGDRIHTVPSVDFAGPTMPNSHGDWLRRLDT